MNVDIPLSNLCLRGGQWWRKQALELVSPVEYILEPGKNFVAFFSLPIFSFVALWPPWISCGRHVIYIYSPRTLFRHPLYIGF